MQYRLLLVCLAVAVAFGCARRDHVVHYPAPSASASVYVEPSAAPSVHNSTVSYEAYAETYEEVWVDDPTYGQVLEICPASVDEWDGYNVVQQIIVTPWGNQLRQRGRFVYAGRWIWVPGFDALPYAAITFSTYHTLPRYQTYRRRHQPRRVAAPRIARVHVRSRPRVRSVSNPRRVYRIARPSVRVHARPGSRSTSRPAVRRSSVQHLPTAEPDVRARRAVRVRNARRSRDLSSRSISAHPRSNQRRSASGKVREDKGRRVKRRSRR